MADIVIRGMEMPKKCGECKAFICYRQWAGDSGDCFCGITKIDVKEDARNADCPLVQLTEGHGRLIDADALSDKMKKTARYFDIRYDLNEAPTVVPAEGGSGK